MIEIGVENFQSIEKVSLQVDGFTSLQGPSNIGKSSIVRAVSYALTGKLGSSFVRHDVDTCEVLSALRDAAKKPPKECSCFSVVTITTPNVKVVWSKGDRVNTYSVTRNGETKEYSALERAGREFLAPDFEEVQIGDSKELLQAVSQFDPIFLFNQSGNVVADVLSDVANLDFINVAVKNLSKDRKANKATLTVRETDLANAKSDLTKYAGLAVWGVALGAAKTKSSAISKAQANLDQVSSLIRNLDRVQESVNNLKPIEAVGKVGVLNAANLDSLAYVANASHHFELSRREVKRLLKVDTLPSVPEVGADKVRALDTVHHLQSKLQTLLECLKSSDVSKVKTPSDPLSLAPVNELTKIGDLESRLSRLQASHAQALRGSVVLSELPAVPTPDCQADLTRVTEAAGFHSKLTTLVKALKQLETDIAELDQTCLSLEAELDELKSTQPTCPTCKQTVPANELHLSH